MRIAFSFSWRHAIRLALYTTLIRALILPVPALASAYVTGPLVAQLAPGVELSVTGRVLAEKPDGISLATVRGSALLGTASPLTGRGSRFVARPPVPVGTTFRLLATGYSSTPDQTDDSPFIAASGAHVYDGMVAANFLPFGTKIRFQNYRPHKVFTVEDRHNPRLSDRVDLWFASRSAALDFGARVLVMEVVG